MQQHPTQPEESIASTAQSPGSSSAPTPVAQRVLQSKRLRWLAAATGIDRAIFFTLVTRGWSMLSGPISILLVVRFLTPEEQGFYYTFSSLLALQVFFELGLSYVLMQCVSHEKASLEWTAGILQGNAVAKQRLASLFQLAVKWYVAVGLLVLTALIPAGLLFFGGNSAGSRVHWRWPWILLVGVTAANLMMTPFYSLIEGIGKVADYARNTARQAFVGTLLFWVALLLGGRLFATPCVGVGTLAVGIIWTVSSYRQAFLDLWHTSVTPAVAVNWTKEVLPFQWKIAVSWLSGYFIFQLANPIMFRYHGPAAAGRIGMSLRIIDSLTAVAYSWVSTKAAPFGTYIARREFATLDALFRRAVIQACAVVVAGGVGLLAAVELLTALHYPIATRLLSPLALLFLVGNALLNCVIFSLAAYLRGHKQEPFLFLSIIGALLTPVVMLATARNYDGSGIAVGVFLLNLLVGLPAAVFIFTRKRREWHR